MGDLGRCSLLLFAAYHLAGHRVYQEQHRSGEHFWVRLRRVQLGRQLALSHGLDQGDVSEVGAQLIAVLNGVRSRWTLISVSCGYAISKFRFPGRRVLLVVIMIGLLMPVALLTVPLYLLFIKMHLVNTMWAMIIPSMVSPFGVFLGNVYADSSVPMELLEAARIDGAGELRIFSTMVLRLLAPAMVTIFLFIFVATWNNFLLPLMMITDENLQPVTQGLYGMMAYFAPDKGAVMLASVIGVVPLVILFLVLQRYWQSGLAAGAVKG